MKPAADFPADLRTLERDYELIRELGVGGMAAVYLARERGTGRLVAIKAVRSRYVDDADALRRFAREARTVADLDHPNIVRTEGIEQIGDRALAIIMQYVAGGTVRDRLRESGPFAAEEAERVLRDVGSALAYAHARGIVHRDVKPENIFLDERSGRALLSDFGIARRIEGDAPITMLGAAVGTPQYMSPEQIDGAAIDGRSDIYSLGVLGWELLTGRQPWAGENLYSIIYKQKHEELPRIVSLRPRVPANLLFAIEGALVKDRSRRWQRIEDFLAQLTYNPPPVLAQNPSTAAVPRQEDDATVEFRPVRASATVAPRPNPPATRRTLFRALALLVPLAIAGISLSVVFGKGQSDERSRSSSARVTTSAGTVVRPDSAVPRVAAPAPSPEAKTPPAAPPSSVPVRPPARVPARAPATAPASARATAPSARCSAPSNADQRACLLAYIAVNDATLQRVYDSLIVELRREARAPRGTPDPPSVTRLRVEQRAWISARDRECTRRPATRRTRYWAEPLSGCFAEMSAARSVELREALQRAKAR